MSGKAVVIDDGVLEIESDLTPQQFLLAHGDGVYTSALLTPEAAVVDWELHKQRLIRGIAVLNERESRPFAPLLAALQSQGADHPLPGFVSNHVTPAVKSALRAFYAEAPGGAGAACTAGGGGDGGAAALQPPLSHAMLVVAVCPHPHPPPPAPPAEPQPGSGSTATGQPPPPQPPPPPPPARVAVYCKAVQPPPYGPGHAAQAAVMGRPRSLAAAKACSWVAERRRYEAAKPPEAAEVLLSDCDGGLLEGLITNFFVVAAAPAAAAASAAAATAAAGNTDGAAAAGAGGGAPAAAGTAAAIAAAAAAGEAAATPASPAFGGLVLQVCAPESGAALPGVAQYQLLQAAAALGVRTELRPPRAGQRDTWREAFLSNCIRRVQPLSRVFCPPANDWGFEPWECALPAPAPGPVTAALREQLLRMEEHTPWHDLD